MSERWPTERIEISEDVLDTLFDRLIEGESLRRICADQDKGMPKKGLFLKRVAADEVLRDRYAEAMHLRATGDVDDIDEIRKLCEDGFLKSDVARVAIDAIKWTSRVRDPKKYGDRQVIAGDPDAPLQGLTTDQLDARIDKLLGEAAQARE